MNNLSDTYLPDNNLSVFNFVSVHLFNSFASCFFIFEFQKTEEIKKANHQESFHSTNFPKSYQNNEISIPIKFFKRNLF